MMRFIHYPALLVQILLPMGISGEYVFEGVATVVMDKYKYEGFSSTPVFWESVNRQFGITITVTDPRSDPDTMQKETNPFSITIHSDIIGQEGSFSIASALLLRTPTERKYLAQYWTFEAYSDGTLEGALTNNHLAEAAVYNLLDVNQEIYPGYSMPFPNTIANGAQISGTLMVDQAQLTIMGNTENQLTFFVITLDAYNENYNAPTQGTSEGTNVQDDPPSQETSTQIHHSSQDTMEVDSANQGTYVFEGVATVVMDKYKYEGFSSTPVFWESVNRQFGITITVTDPRSDPDTMQKETNPFSITIHSDIIGQEGSFSIASALLLRTPTERKYLAQYWTFEAYSDGTLEGTLTNNHLAEAAVYNLLDVNQEIYPGYSMPFPNTIANGAQISGTLMVDQAQLTIMGNTENQLTFFVITLDAYNENYNAPTQGTSEGTNVQDDPPSQETSTQIHHSSQDTLGGDSTKQGTTFQGDILSPSSHSPLQRSILEQSLIILLGLHSLCVVLALS
ncbi:hypothetical protein IV203_022627 [Nitzschia inconspicua]|uniref:Uncharacterized protein n=1 Tax=Nitzschia inconspicua TaxID=303405 RepID=A0A9K3KK96_9STRA|nr:hypothetical protein IV203_022627 [Nitzschia inconspicua]